MHKKGITEEVAKKRSRRTVKHQRGVAGLDMAAILAKRNQSEQVRAKARSDAVAKAKEVKKAKEAKKEKSKVRLTFFLGPVDARWPDQLTVITIFLLSPLHPHTLDEFRLLPELLRPLRKFQSSKRRVLEALAGDDTNVTFLVVGQVLIGLLPSFYASM